MQCCMILKCFFFQQCFIMPYITHGAGPIVSIIPCLLLKFSESLHGCWDYWRTWDKGCSSPTGFELHFGKIADQYFDKKLSGFLMVVPHFLQETLVPFMWTFTGLGMEKNLLHMVPWCKTYEVLKHDFFFFLNFWNLCFYAKKKIYVYMYSASIATGSGPWIKISGWGWGMYFMKRCVLVYWRPVYLDWLLYTVFHYQKETHPVSLSVIWL